MTVTLHRRGGDGVWFHPKMLCLSENAGQLTGCLFGSACSLPVASTNVADVTLRLCGPAVAYERCTRRGRMCVFFCCCKPQRAHETDSHRTGNRLAGERRLFSPRVLYPTRREDGTHRIAWNAAKNAINAERFCCDKVKHWAEADNNRAMQARVSESNSAI